MVVSQPAHLREAFSSLRPKGTSRERARAFANDWSEAVLNNAELGEKRAEAREVVGGGDGWGSLDEATAVPRDALSASASSAESGPGENVSVDFITKRASWDTHR